MTTTTTSRKPATKAAAKAKRTDAPKRTEAETAAADAVARLTAGTITTAEAIAEAKAIDTTITKRSTHDGVAVLSLVGTVAIAEYEAKHGKPDAKAALPSLSTVADYFVTTTVGKDSGYKSATVRQAVTIARIADRFTTLSLWDRFSAMPAAVESDPDAYKPTIIAFVRFATAWKADRVNGDTGVIYSAKAAAKEGDTTKIAAIVNATKASEAADKAKKAKAAMVRKAKAEASASEAMIGAIRVSDVAALSTKQRKALADLLKTLES